MHRIGRRYCNAQYQLLPRWRGMSSWHPTFRISCARSMAMTEAAQPMPERLKVRMLLLNLKWLTTAADSEGVGLKAEQFTMSPSTCKQRPGQSAHQACGTPAGAAHSHAWHHAHEAGELGEPSACGKHLCGLHSLEQTGMKGVRKGGLLAWFGLSPVRSSTFWMHTLSAVSVSTRALDNADIDLGLLPRHDRCRHGTRESSSLCSGAECAGAACNAHQHAALLAAAANTLLEMHQCTEYHSIASVWHSSIHGIAQVAACRSRPEHTNQGESFGYPPSGRNVRSPRPDILTTVSMNSMVRGSSLLSGSRMPSDRSTSEFCILRRGE